MRHPESESIAGREPHWSLTGFMSWMGLVLQMNCVTTWIPSLCKIGRLGIECRKNSFVERCNTYDVVDIRFL